MKLSTGPVIQLSVSPALTAERYFFSPAANFLITSAFEEAAAHQRMGQGSGIVRQTAWYRKSCPTFSNALALVRKELWAQDETFCGSVQDNDMVKVPREFVERLTEAVCYAA